jgi:hypothetical protein
MSFPPTYTSTDVPTGTNLNFTDSTLNLNGLDVKCPNASISVIPASIGGSVSLLPPNDVRRTFVVLNDTQTGVMRLTFGPVATSTEFTFLLYPKETLVWETFSYTGALSCTWDVADGFARVTEIY